MITIPGFRCHCGSDEVMAVEPGEEETREIFLLRKERPAKAWCLSCWSQRFGEQAA